MREERNNSTLSSIVRRRTLWMFWKRFDSSGLRPIIFYILKWFKRVSFTLKVKIIFESTIAYNKTRNTIHRMTNHKIRIQINWVLMSTFRIFGNSLCVILCVCFFENPLFNSKCSCVHPSLTQHFTKNKKKQKKKKKQLWNANTCSKQIPEIWTQSVSKILSFSNGFLFCCSNIFWHYCFRFRLLNKSIFFVLVFDGFLFDFPSSNPICCCINSFRNHLNIN